MTSFIEIPQLSFNGRETQPFYVNVTDIISFEKSYDNGTEFRVRDLGVEGLRFKSYLPIDMFLNALDSLGRFPRVRTWTDETKDAYRIPAQERARATAERERGAKAT
jgi:hypothetical protein